MLEDEPLYKHDCDACRFLGRYTYDAPLIEGTQEMAVDLYVCPQHGRPTVLARASSDGPNYSSFPLSILWRQPMTKEPSTYEPAIFEAVRRLGVSRVLGTITRGGSSFTVLDVTHKKPKGPFSDMEHYLLHLDDGKELTVFQDDGQFLVFGGRVKPLFVAEDAQHFWSEAQRLVAEANQRALKALNASRGK